MIKVFALLRPLAAVAVLLHAAGCGKDSGDTAGTGGPAPLVTPWAVTDQEGTALAAADLAARVNAETTLTKLAVDALVLPTPPTARLARLASGIDACIAKKIGELPVSVTSDSLRVDYALDLTALCDEAPKTAETVTEISNTANGVIVVSCVGGDFKRFADKTLTDVRAAGSVCAGSDLIHFALDLSYTARKVETTVAGDVTTTRVIREERRTSWATSDGHACQIQLDKKLYAVAPCRFVQSTKTFDGAPEAEVLPIADPTGPKLALTQLDFGALTYEQGATYYAAGSVGFWLNGWQGTLTYTNGWAPPRWDAVKGTEQVSGTLGQTGLRNPEVRPLGP